MDLLNSEHGALSAVALVPAIAGMVLGQQMRRGLSDHVFRKAFFVSLLALGTYIAASAFAGIDR